jgi:hypothetical protein
MQGEDGMWPASGGEVPHQAQPVIIFLREADSLPAHRNRRTVPTPG